METAALPLGDSQYEYREAGFEPAHSSLGKKICCIDPYNNQEVNHDDWVPGIGFEPTYPFGA